MGDQFSTPPSVGQVSGDGAYRWDGNAWVPIRGRRPTAWTRPMQLVVAIYSATASVVSVGVQLLNIDALRQLSREALLKQPNLPAGQVDVMADTVVTVGIATTVGFGLIYLFVALGSLLGWNWIFWVALVLYGLGSLGFFTSAATLTVPSPIPTWSRILSLAVSTGYLAIFIWMALGLIRYRGAWARIRAGG